MSKKPETLKLCVSCVHFRQVVFLDSHPEFDPDAFPNFTETYRSNVCIAPQIQVRNLVTGLYQVISAPNERSNGICGPEGTLFEEKPDE